MTTTAIAPPQHQGRRYPAKVAARAVELRAADWPLDKISELLASEFGLPTRPAPSTVLRWTDPANAEYHRRHGRANARRNGAANARFALPGPRVKTPEYVIALIHALDREGVTARSIAGTLRLLLAEPRWTGGMVLGVLKDGRVPYMLRGNQ